MGIRNKIEYLKDTKELIKNAIISKGVDIPEDSPFRSYAEKIGLIPNERVETEVQFGPYTHPNFDLKNDVFITTGGLPSVPSEQEFPKFEWDKEWYDLEFILDSDQHDYPAKMIVQYLNNDTTIDLYGADYYVLSDGSSYLAPSQTETITHTWIPVLDKIASTGGYGHRWVMYFFTEPGRVGTVQKRYNTIADNAVAVITKGFRWQPTNGSTSYDGARQYQPFANMKYLQYVKTKDSDWSECYNMTAWFAGSKSLITAELDFDSPHSISMGPAYMRYMFYDCYGLKFIKLIIPPNVYDFREMFYYCRSLTHAYIDFRYASCGKTVECYDMFYNCDRLYDVVLNYDNKNDYKYSPWIQIECPMPLKVSQVSYRNARDYTSNSNYSGYSTQYPAICIKVEASNDGLNWVDMGEIRPKLRSQCYTESIDVDDTNAYVLWRFRATELATSYFTAQCFIFQAKYEVEHEDGTKTWEPWTQPTFTSDNQDGYCILTSSVSGDSGNAHCAFNVDTAYNKHWRSASISVGNYFTRAFGDIFRASDNLHLCTIKGGHNVKSYYFGYWRFQYYVFEDTTNVTSFSSTFTNNNRLIGVIIPNQDNVTTWAWAFEACTAMTVAPQIKVRPNASVAGMFSGSTVSNLTHLDVKDLIDAYRLFYNCDSIGYLNIELPNATSIYAICENCHNLYQVCIKAPKTRTMGAAFQETPQLRDAKVYGFNQKANERVWANYARPNFTQDTWHGNVTYDDTLSITSGNLWHMFTTAEGNTRFTGTGCIYWELPHPVKLSNLGIHTGLHWSLECKFKFRFWADAEKTIPLTEEIATDGHVYTSFRSACLDPDQVVTTLVLEITENGNYADINQLLWTATKEESGYMTDMHYCFYNSLIRYIDIDSSEVVNMDYTFHGATSIKDLPHLDYGKVQTMSNAFRASSISQLQGAYFPSVRNIDYAFYGCDRLINIDGLDLPICTNFDYAFYSCDSLAKVHKPNWPKARSFNYAFYCCYSLSEADLSTCPEAHNFNHAFYSCESLMKVVLPVGTQSLSHAFYNCYRLKLAEILDTTHITDMRYAFYGCNTLTHITPLNIPLCTDMDYSFQHNTWLESIDLIDLSSVETMQYAFQHCYQLKSVEVPDLPKCTTMQFAFDLCRLLESITFNALPVCHDMGFVVGSCRSLKTVDFKQTTSAVTSFDSAFNNNHSLIEISIPDTSNVINFHAMFDGCRNLKTISELDASRGSNFARTFRFCNSLQETPIKFTTSSASNMEAMYEECHSFVDWSFLDNYVMHNVSNAGYMFRNNLFEEFTWKYALYSSCIMNHMFDRCYNLHTLTIDFLNRRMSGEHMYMFADNVKMKNLNLLNTAGFSRFDHMFRGCHLENIAIDLNDYYDTRSYIEYMFADCPELRTISINFAGRDYGNYNYNYYGRLFANCPKLTYINMLEIDAFRSWERIFSDMRNEEPCTVNWNDSAIYPYFRYAFSGCDGAPLVHINAMGKTNHHTFKAYNPNYHSGYISEPQAQFPYAAIKFPFDVQVSSVEFVQRTGTAEGDEYEFPDRAVIYSSLYSSDVVSPVVSLNQGTLAATEIELYEPVVTDTVTCHFGRDYGRYMGVGQLNIRAKAKGTKTLDDWTQPTFTSDYTWGQVWASSYYNSSSNPWRAVDGGTSYYWQASSDERSAATWGWDFGNWLTVSKIRVYARPYYRSGTYEEYTGTVRILSADLRQVLFDTTEMERKSGAYLDFTFSTPKSLSGIRIEVTGYYVGLSEVQITAKEENYTYYPWVTQGVGTIDFKMPLFTEWQGSAYTFYSTRRLPSTLIYRDNDSGHCYGMFQNCFQKEINVPWMISNATSGDYMFDLNSYDYNTSNLPLIIRDLDFYGFSDTTSYRGSWFRRSYDIATPVALENPRNIRGTTDLSMMDLTHDSLLQVFSALMSRKGISANTLTLGSHNLSKLTDAEKAVAINKNWNLA